MALMKSAAADDPLTNHYEAGYTEKAVVIDGRLDDPAWSNAVSTPIFGEIATGLAPRFGVWAKLLWDETNLYMAFHVEDTNVWAYKTIRDDPMGGQKVGLISGVDGVQTAGWGPYDESFIKIYIDADGDGRNYIEMHVNPLNKVCDKWQEEPWRVYHSVTNGIEKKGNKHPNPHPEWNCPGLKTGVSIRGSLNDEWDIDEGWNVEVAIPFKSIREVCGGTASAPQEGEIWRMHFGRRYQASLEQKGKDASYWTWPAIGISDCHIPERWGYVTFVKTPREDRFAKLPKHIFEWKALAVPGADITNQASAIEMVTAAADMGFNVLIVQATGRGGSCYYDSAILKKVAGLDFDPLRVVVTEAARRKMAVFAWTVNLHMPPKDYYKEHPDRLQKVRAWEEEAAHLPRINPDRVNVHKGDCLCPDRGVDELEKAVFAELITNYPLKGIALDYVGYRNYYACFCEYSNERRKQWAQSHPEFSEKEVMASFSEESLVRWVEQARAVIANANPSAELEIHIYPDFDLNPMYGNRLPVEHCSLTTAWFYGPFWSYEKIEATALRYKSAEHQYHSCGVFTPLIGVPGGDKFKSPERVRREIRIAGSSGARAIMIAFYGALRENPEIAKVIKEELGD